MNLPFLLLNKNLHSSSFPRCNSILRVIFLINFCSKKQVNLNLPYFKMLINHFTFYIQMLIELIIVYFSKPLILYFLCFHLPNVLFDIIISLSSIYFHLFNEIIYVCYLMLDWIHYKSYQINVYQINLFIKKQSFLHHKFVINHLFHLIKHDNQHLLYFLEVKN